MSDELLDRNARYADRFDRPDLPGPPSRGLAVVACMDARLDVAAALGIDLGEAHVIRNAGGIVTDDVIRSLCLSQRALGTRRIVLVHHTRCGVQGLDDESFADGVEADVGERPPWPFGGFADAEDDVRESARRLVASPFVPVTDEIRGFVYDVDTGRLHEVALDA